MIMSVIQSAVNNMNALSNFSERGVIKIYDDSKDNLIQVCMFQRNQCDIRRQNRDLIVGNCLNIIYGFLMRAYEEGDRLKYLPCASEASLGVRVPWCRLFVEVSQTEILSRDHVRQRPKVRSSFGG